MKQRDFTINLSIDVYSFIKQLLLDSDIQKIYVNNVYNRVRLKDKSEYTNISVRAFNNSMPKNNNELYISQLHHLNFIITWRISVDRSV